MKNHTESVKICTEILDFDKRNISVLRLRGNAKLDMIYKIEPSNYACNNSAIADFTEAIDLEKGSESFDKSALLKINESLSRSYAYRAVAYMDCDLGAALSDLDNAISLNGSNGGAYYNRGIVHKSKGNKAKACEDFTKAQQYGVNSTKQLNELKCL
jgi:tetratricopeptide (TPR) repeat protein